MRRETFVVDLVRGSRRSDLTCIDGEVDTWERVDWLEEKADNPDAKNPDSSATAKPAMTTVYSVNLESQEAQLPPGSHLLAFHRPESAEGSEPFAIFMQQNGALAAKRMQGSAPVFNIGFVPTSVGRIVRAFPFRDLLTLMGERGVAWLLYDADSANYHLLNSLPEAPDISFSMDAAHLSGYTRLAGNLPEMTVEVDLSSLPEEIDRTALTEWLGQGHGSAVDAAVKQIVYEAVEKRVTQYMTDVKDAGLFLLPVRCVAAFGDALPSESSVPDTGYSTPYARLAEFSVGSSTLTLKLQFSLRPMQLTASFQINTLQQSWNPVFGELNIFTASEPGWTIGSTTGTTMPPIATAFNSLPESAGGGFAFRFDSRSAAGIKSLAGEMEDFRLSCAINIRKVTSGVVIVGRPNPTAAKWSPDYNDFLPIQPDGGALTDEGVVFWTDRTLLTPVKWNGVVYRHRDNPADHRIFGVAQAYREKGASKDSRHPLWIFCEDAIRQAYPDGEGGYRNSRIISRDPAINPDDADGRSSNPTSLITELPAGVAFLTERGLQIISSAGKVISAVPAPVGTGGEAYRINSLHYLHSADLILATTAAGGILLYEVGNDAWYIPAESQLAASSTLIGVNGSVYTTGTDNSVCRVMTGRSEITAAAASTAALSAESADASFPLSALAADLPRGYCRLRTRPLKFRNPFGRCRIHSVAAAPSVRVAIEGSDDLVSWRLLADLDAPATGLHTVACRYHRVTLTAREEESSLMHRIRLAIDRLE